MLSKHELGEIPPVDVRYLDMCQFARQLERELAKAAWQAAFPSPSRNESMWEAAAYCRDCAEASERCGAQGLAAAQNAMANELQRRAVAVSSDATALKNAAPQPQQEVSSGVVESSTDGRPKARNESGSDTAAAAAPSTGAEQDVWGWMLAHPNDAMLMFMEATSPDTFGIKWDGVVRGHVREITPEEMRKFLNERLREMMGRDAERLFA